MQEKRTAAVAAGIKVVAADVLRPAQQNAELSPENGKHSGMARLAQLQLPFSAAPELLLLVR